MKKPEMKVRTMDRIKPFPVLPPGVLVPIAAPDELGSRNSPEHEAMAEVIRSTALLSPAQSTENIAGMVAGIARRILQSGFVLIALQPNHCLLAHQDLVVQQGLHDQQPLFEDQHWIFSCAGDAPLLQASFQQGLPFLETAVHAAYTFRQKDPASDRRTAFMMPDSPQLRPLLGCPIRIKGIPVGILLAFGKTGAEAFTESDVFLAELLVTQAASVLESSNLYQELQNNLQTTQILYDLTQQIALAEDLQAAVNVVAHTAQRLFHPEACGLLLFTSNGNKEAEVSLPSKGEHPYELVHRVMADEQMVYIARDNNLSIVCVPVQTSRRCYGALWLQLKETSLSYQVPEKIMQLMNQAVVAMERLILLAETQQKTLAIEKAYREQEEAHQNFLEALMKLLEARDGETKEHSARVRKFSKELGEQLGLSKAQFEALDRGALLHDIGKIKIRDDVLLKKGPLSEEEWVHMRTHPTVGAGVVQLLPAWRDALPVITYHQERWDGSGYPLGLVGTDIPLLARIFAVVDVYDALTSDRPYRSRLTSVEALEYLESQAGVHFDPQIVEKMAVLVRKIIAEQDGS
jgi:putative nucleotidyltransferase with HDIG domain